MTTIERLKENYLHELAVQGYARGTIRYRKIYLEQFLLFLQKKKISRVQELSRKTLYAYQTLLVHLPYAPLTVHSKLSVVCCFLRYLFEQDVLLYDLSAVINFPKRALGLPKSILTEQEVNQFLDLPDVRTRKGIRDKAILELLYSSGIRRAELTGLDLYDLNREEGMIKVMGKGQKERVVPVGSAALHWLDNYIKQVRCLLNPKSNALFLDLILGRRLSSQTLTHLIREYVSQTSLHKKITPHSFRHTFASHLLKHGADIRYIQEMLGHASPETTQIYTRIEITDLEEVYRKTHPRGRKK